MILATALAITGICLRKRWPLILASIVILPSSFYFFGGNNWVRLMGIYIPLSMLSSAYFIAKSRLLPALLITPIILFYVWVGYSVATQVTGPGVSVPIVSPSPLGDLQALGKRACHQPPPRSAT